MSQIGRNNPPPGMEPHFENPIEYLRHLVRYTAISTTVKAVGHELACSMDNEGFCCPSNKALMLNTGIKDERTMTAALEVIEKELRVFIERKNGARNKIYAPKPPTSNDDGLRKPPTLNAPASNVGGQKPPTLNAGGLEKQLPTLNACGPVQPPAFNVGGLERGGGDYRGGGDRSSVASIGLAKNKTQRQVMSEKEFSDPPPPAKQKKRNKISYTESFESFWKAYPTDPNMSKKKAFEQWKRLDEDDQQKAVQAVPLFVGFCQQDPTYRPLHAERFLSQRRFDGFLDNDKQHYQSEPEKVPYWKRNPDAFRRLTFEKWTGGLEAANLNGRWPEEKFGPYIDNPNCLMPDEVKTWCREKFGDKYLNGGQS